MLKKFLRNENGSALVIVIMVFMVIVILGASAVLTLNVETIQANTSYKKAQAYYLARAGADATAASIIKQQDILTSAQMDALLTSLDGKTSSPKSLNGSNDCFVVKVTKIGDDISILSKGTIGNIDSEVTLIVKKKCLTGAIYNMDTGTDTSEIIHPTEITGDIILKNIDSLTEDSMEHLNDDGIYPTEDSSLNFPSVDSLVDFNPPFSVTFTDDSTPLTGNCTLVSGGNYTSGISLGNNKIATINVTSDAPVYIRAASLNMSNNSQIKIARTAGGTGKVYLYIDGGPVKITAGKINAGGNPADVIIYKNGSTTDTSDKFEFSNSCEINADICVKSYELSSANQVKYSGQLIYAGEHLNLKNKYGSLYPSVIYAPNATANIDTGAVAFNGILIAKQLGITNGEFNYIPSESSNLLGSVLFKYAKDMYK